VDSLRPSIWGSGLAHHSHCLSSPPGNFPWNDLSLKALLLTKAPKRDSVLKNGDISLPTKVPVVKSIVFPVVMYGCESWTIKKIEWWRTDAFKLWSWRRLLRVSWIARRSSQSILKEINPEYVLEGLMLNLTPILWPPDGKSGLSGKDPDARNQRLRARRQGAAEGEMVGSHHWLNGHEFEKTLGESEGQGGLVSCSPWAL